MVAPFAGGLLQGFVQTQLQMRRDEEERRRRDEEFALKKEHFKLQQQILRGEEAHRSLQAEKYRLDIQNAQREAFKNLIGAQIAGQQFTPQAAPEVAPQLPGPATEAPGPQESVPIPALRPQSSGLRRAPANIQQLYQVTGARYGVDPLFLEAFQTAIENPAADPKAEGPMTKYGRAQGLMQILPATAERYGGGDLTDPATNIDRAAQYIADLQRKYGNDPIRIAAAYFTGEGRVPKAGALPNTTDGTVRTPQYAERVVRQYLGLRGSAGQAGQAQVDAPARAPSGMAQTPELVNLDNALRANREEEQAIIAQASQAGVLDHPQIKARLDRLRQDRQELITQRGQAIQGETQGGELRQYQRQYGPSEGLRRYREDRLELARRQGEIGVTQAAERTADVTTAKAQAEREFRLTQTLHEADPKNFQNYLYRDTGEQVSEGDLYADVKPLVGKRVRVTTDDERKRYDLAVSASSPLAAIRQELASIYGPGGIYENLKGSGRLEAGVKGLFNRLTQDNPDLEVGRRIIKGNIDLLRRTFQGQVGTQTEGDAQRGLAAIADLETLLPDSKEVAYRLVNEIITSVNKIRGRILRNPEFRDPELQPLLVDGATPTRRRVVAP